MARDANDPNAEEHERRDEAEESADERRFVEDLLERGEAAEPVDGELPPDATHEIVEKRPGRPPKVRRRSFTLD